MSAGFRCPQCERPGSLAIEMTLRLPGDSRSDDIAIHLVACTQCEFLGASVYEESRRGGLRDDAWDHSGYRLPKGAYLELSTLIRSCPNPGNDDCHCEAHRTLNGQDGSGRWVGLGVYGPIGHFPMRWTS